ncbi:LRR 8 domain containing protein, partial [Asbolus verrucosus]
ELKSLECRSCGLTKIDPKVYELLPHLTHLDFGDNELTSITSDEFEPLTNLRHLKLDGNRITAIKSSVFFNQQELKRLNLARNGLAKISRNAFDNLHNLTELDLSQNKFENPENGLLEPVADTLEVLLLNGNHLSLHTLKRLLNNLEIKELHLAGCGLGGVPVVPETVSVLNLANNHISSIPAEMIPESLKELDISGNKFRGLDKEAMMKLDNLKSFKLERNPWSCDLCNIVPLLERVNRSAAIRNVQCVEPYAAKGKKLGIVKRNELTWCTLPNYTSSDANFFLLGDDGKIGLIAAGTSVSLLFLTVVVVLGALCYSRRHAAKYYTHEDKLAMEGDSIFDNHSPLFCDERELSFKFPLDGGEKKLSVSTIDEIKKEHAITNGT